MKKRVPLTQERVLRTAVALADERGVDELSMRKLAKELGVEAMSLYNHVANKDDLLDGMIDIVFSEIDPPAAGGDWKAELRKRAVSTLRGAAPAPWAIGEMEGRSTHGPANLRIHDAVLGCLRGAGFSMAMTVARLLGAGRLHLRLRPPAERHDTRRRRRTSRRWRSGRCVEYEAALADFPHLVEVVGGHVAKVGYDYDAEFLFGLDVILDALERRLAPHGE